MLFAVLSSSAATYKIEDVPNVHLANKNHFVSDPDNLISQEAENNANSKLRNLMDSTSAEVAVVLLSSIGDADIFDFTQSLFRKWGLGKEDKDNGLMIMFVIDQRKVRIHTGYGVEGVLPDISARNIIEYDIIPHWKSGNLDKAVESAVDRVYNIFTDPVAAEELKSMQPNDAKAKSDDSGIYQVFILMIILSFGLSIFLFFRQLYKIRNKTNYQKTEEMQKCQWIMLGLAFLSAGAALIFFGLSLMLAKYYRNKPIKCDCCGSKMNKLNEEEDNNYLSDEQNLEEQLNSVDYDVWLCPRCGTKEIFSFVSRTTSYKKCPLCYTQAMSLLYDRIELQPTPTREGRGVRVYECRYCGNHHEDRYVIEKTAPPVVFIGGGGGKGFGGGGGFSGGSFGGGSSGGGGATGGW